jgi:hypothetical protein
MLIGFCEELNIQSVLTTAVINWARSSVREIDLARRLCHYAVTRRTLPKRVEPRLVMLRDSRLTMMSEDELRELQRRIKDPNWRLFAANGTLYAMNNEHFIKNVDPFLLFDQMPVDNVSHAFYLGYELMKAKTALSLGKDYRQDQALDWGFLTEPEISRRDRKTQGEEAAT